MHVIPEWWSLKEYTQVFSCSSYILIIKFYKFSAFLLYYVTHTLPDLSYFKVNMNKRNCPYQIPMYLVHWQTSKAPIYTAHSNNSNTSNVIIWSLVYRMFIHHNCDPVYGMMSVELRHTHSRPTGDHTGYIMMKIPTENTDGNAQSSSYKCIGITPNPVAWKYSVKCLHADYKAQCSNLAPVPTCTYSRGYRVDVCLLLWTTQLYTSWIIVLSITIF